MFRRWLSLLGLAALALGSALSMAGPASAGVYVYGGVGVAVGRGVYPGYYSGYPGYSPYGGFRYPTYFPNTYLPSVTTPAWRYNYNPYGPYSGIYAMPGSLSVGPNLPYGMSYPYSSSYPSVSSYAPPAAIQSYYYPPPSLGRSGSILPPSPNASQNLYYQSPAPPAETSPTKSELLLDVRVPPDATVWVNGARTTQAGAMRQYLSEDLAPGKTYNYEIRASWNDNGKPVDRTRQIKVRGGERHTLNFLASDD